MDALELFRLDGKTVVITGAGRGLGKTLVDGLASVGANIVACDINSKGCQSAIEDLPGRPSAFRCDVTSPDDLKELIAELDKRYDQLDVWINNAGIDLIEPTLDVNLDHWRKVLDVNLTGAFAASQVAALSMIKSNGGVIINITSIAATTGIRNLAAYSASKAGLAQLTRVMALELAPHNIRVNSIAPGYLENIMADAEDEHSASEKAEQIRLFTPLGRRARLTELIGPVVFLASDASSYVTGATIAVDGGYTAI